MEGNQGTVSEIRQSHKSSDLETATRLAHTVKGVAGTLGANDIVPIAGDLEAAFKQNELDKVDDQISEFKAKLSVVLQGLESFFAEEAAQKGEEGPVAETAIDPAIVRPMLQELSNLLESDLMVAMTQLETLRPLLENSSVKDLFHQLETEMDSFDTDSAKSNLLEIADALDISLGENG
jgi:two-component system sensor histidine kinase/response regulator